MPIQLGVIDYKHKVVRVEKEYHPTGDIDTDLRAIKAYYADMAPLARHPDKFRT